MENVNVLNGFLCSLSTWSGEQTRHHTFGQDGKECQLHPMGRRGELAPSYDRALSFVLFIPLLISNREMYVFLGV